MQGCISFLCSKFRRRVGFLSVILFACFFSYQFHFVLAEVYVALNMYEQISCTD